MNRGAEANVRADECTPSSRVLYWLWEDDGLRPYSAGRKWGGGVMQRLILAPRIGYCAVRRGKTNIQKVWKGFYSFYSGTRRLL